MLISFKDDHIGAVVSALKKKRPSSAQVDRERLHEKLQESQERRRRRRQLATSSRLASHNRSVVPLGLFLLFFYTLFNENPPINIPRFSRRRSSSSNGCSVKQANLTVSWQPSEVVLSAGLGLGLFACMVAV